MPVLAAPINLTATEVSTGVQLSWTNIGTSTTGYALDRSSDGKNWDEFADTAGSMLTGYLDNTAGNESWEYRIQAAMPGERSDYSTPAYEIASPTNLQTAVVGRGVQVSWTSVSSPFVSGFEVERSTDSGTTWTPLIANTRSPKNTFTDTTTTAGGSYEYQVIAKSNFGSSIPSAPGWYWTAPTAPSNLTATVSGESVQLQWINSTTRDTSVEIDRSSDYGATWSAITFATGTAEMFTDGAVAGNHAYLYQVRAVNGAVDSAFSNQAYAPIGIAPAASVSAEVVSSTAALIQWTDTNGGNTSYEVDRSPDGSTGWISVGTNTPGSATNLTDFSLSASTNYFYRVVAIDGQNTAVSSTVNVQTYAPGSSGPQYLLNSVELGVLRSEAASGSPQWESFKATLDASLNQVIDPGWEGSNLNWLTNYAMAYQILQVSDPKSAEAYADKAIGLLASATQGLVDESGSGTDVLVGTGNGSTTAFTLPNAGVDASTLSVWTPTITVDAVTRGNTPSDQIDYYTQIVSVSDSANGSPSYTKGVDYEYDPDNLGQIKWLTGGRQPAAGATYYVSEATAWQAQLVTNFRLVGNQIVFNSAPSSNQAVFAQYLYTDPTTGLKYQQSNNGMGGVGSIAHDGGYPARYLANVAIGLDWLWSSPDLSAALRSSTMNELVQWNNWLTNDGYNINMLESNYGDADFAFQMATAVALNGRDLTDAPILLAEVSADQTMLLDALANPLTQPQLDGSGNVIGTEFGGYWGEGWNYGSFAIQNIITSETAAEQAGIVPQADASIVNNWANQVTDAFIETQPTPTTAYDGGDGYVYPLAMPNETFFSIVGSTATNAAEKSYDAYLAQIDPVTTGTVQWQDLEFQNTAAPSSDWAATLPLQYYSAGNGLVTARGDWSYDSTWLAFQSGDLVQADHQSYAQGNLEIDRGADQLLINAAAYTADQNPQDKSRYSNSVVIDDGGAGQQTYNSAQGQWYGSTGVTMTHFEGTSAFMYAQGNYAAAYTKNYGGADSPNPASELVRDVFYVRSDTGTDYTIVYDRATTTEAQFTKQLQWNFAVTPTVSGDGWSVAVGNSKLFGQTYSDVALTTEAQTVDINGTPVQEVVTNPATATASVRYVTVLQSSPSTTGSADPSTHIQSTDGQLEGVQVANTVVLFGRNGQVNGGSTYSLTAAAGQVVTHYLSDMVPGETYLLSGTNQGAATADAQGVLTFTTTGTGSSQTVELASA